IDAGSEPLAQFFQEDAALFCLKDAQTSKGFNPFSVSVGKGDDGFVRHMMELIRMMLEMNEARENQQLDASEQQALTDAIIHTMQQAGQ
ncbi:type IV secretion system protein B4, partial [Vibrio alfacsensis]